MTQTTTRTPLRRPSLWQALRPLLIRIHFYVGIFVGPFIAIAAITGGLYALTPALEQVVHRDQLQVEPGEQRVPMAQQIAAGAAAVPDGTLLSIRTDDEDPTATTRVIFDAPSAPADRTLTAFVDPWTGEVTGVLPTYANFWLPVRTWFDELHRNLLLGEPGRIYSELAASWLWVMALSGLALWVFRARKRARLRATLLPQRTGSVRVRTLSWHATLGLWLGIGMLFLSATGLTWSTFAGGNVSALRGALDWNRPSVSTDLHTVGSSSAPSAAPDSDLATTVSEVLELARAEGLHGPVRIIPSEAGEAWQAVQNDREWPVRLDALAVDPESLTVTDRVDFEDWPFAAKLANWGIDGHMGVLFGLPNQIGLLVLALGIVVVIFHGYRMWWRRRPTRPVSALPNGPGGGASSQVRGGRAPITLPGPLTADHTDPRAAMVVAALALAIGLFAPVLGVSLLCFLALDAIRTTLNRRPS